VVPRQLFVSLPVRDLDRSKVFFAKLGFTFDRRFTDANAACMVVSALGKVMLLEERFFRTFTHREPCDTTRRSEGLVAFSCDSRADVDAIAGAALAAGGSRAMDPLDHGFMYVRSFSDPDGHRWEVFWMDPRRAPGADDRPAPERQRA
jgi:predicted lactoylglutathione lyase